MDWIEFVSKHSGSPFAPKMRHHNIRGIELSASFQRIEQKIEQKVGNSASTLIQWLRATEQKISLDDALKFDRKLPKILVTQKDQQQS